MITKTEIITYDYVEKFSRAIGVAITKLQNEGLEVEVQFKPCTVYNHQIQYIAMLIGRKPNNG